MQSLEGVTPLSYRTALAEVLTRAVAPCAELTGREGRFPRGAVTAFGATGLLGLTVSTEFGGAGLGLPEAAEVVARTARVCPATAAVLRSHYTAVAVIESYGSPWVRGEIAAGRHLSTLALMEDDNAEHEMEAHLLMPRCTAVRSGGVVALRACKRRVVAAGEADGYVWSSRPLGAPDGLSLWGVPAHAPDLFVPAGRTPWGRPAARHPRWSPIRCWSPPTCGSVRTAAGSTSCSVRSCRGCSNFRPPSLGGRATSRLSESGPPTPSRRPELQPVECRFGRSIRTARPDVPADVGRRQSLLAPAAICRR